MKKPLNKFTAMKSYDHIFDVRKTIGYMLAHDTTGRYAAWTPEQKAWVHDLHSIAGAWCCDIADGQEAQEVVWDVGKKGYTVVIEGKTYDVTPGTIIDAPNLIGIPLVWYYMDNDEAHKRSAIIRCFLPGTLT